MFAEAETWVAIAFLILIGIFIYVGVPGVVAKALDRRAERIKERIKEAKAAAKK